MGYWGGDTGTDATDSGEFRVSENDEFSGEIDVDTRVRSRLDIVDAEDIDIPESELCFFAGAKAPAAAASCKRRTYLRAHSQRQNAAHWAIQILQIRRSSLLRLIIISARNAKDGAMLACLPLVFGVFSYASHLPSSASITT